MNSNESKELLTALYRTIQFVQVIIETQMDVLIKNGNTNDFSVILLSLVEISIQLLRS